MYAHIYYIYTHLKICAIKAEQAERLSLHIRNNYIENHYIYIAYIHTNRQMNMQYVMQVVNPNFKCPTISRSSLYCTQHTQYIVNAVSFSIVVI